MNHDQQYHFSYFSLPSPSPSLPATFYPDLRHSPISLPEVRLFQNAQPELHRPISDSPVRQYRSQSDTYSFATPTRSEVVSPAPEVRPRIPRPPNAFMLFRSNMLRTKAIPQTAEKRQQQLSKVAGECWNLLSPEEKQVWHNEAAKQLREHQLKYPHYKFTPAARGSSRKMKKDGQQSVVADKNRVRELREKWTQIYGPAVAPSRRRKPKQNAHSLPRSEPDPSLESLFTDPSFAFTSSPPSSLTASPSSSVSDGSLPPIFPNPSYPHYSENQPYSSSGFFMNDYPFPRPSSTSSNSSCDGSVISSASSFDAPSTSFAPSYSVSSSPPLDDNALCAGFSGLDITPTATSFRESDMCPQPLNPLRQPPSFIRLSNEGTSSELPFLSPLVPSPSEHGANYPEESYVDGTSAYPGFIPPFLYDSSRLGELDFNSLGPIPSPNGDSLNFGSWSFIEEESSGL
ncbi:hypothetical protein C8R41DRAFT_922661 [Lentinula lateritia]|uniref:HMG box domain-containing protein n=1 Tax=Lentinula lateritia TaxID=40482 RepID=A0ABQ8V813_9AGAR|nr:hypothetical protein C8R41DRAFT_922661 [Lentinula lateritia]